MSRYIAISFPFLLTDWYSIQQPGLKKLPVVVCAPSHGRMIIVALNSVARAENIEMGMVLADARAIVPYLHVINEQKNNLAERLLKKIAEWCIRFTPVASLDLPDGILLDVSGCTHLWGGDQAYLDNIISKFKQKGYSVKTAMADTIGAAWGLSRYSGKHFIVAPGSQFEAISTLPPEALRLEQETVEKLHKLGLRKVRDFINLPRPVLLRRFGQHMIKRLAQALGNEEECVEPVCSPELYSERLPCLEPIVTATGIEIALNNLLDVLCARLKNQQKGLRKIVFRCYRIDNKVEAIEVGTSRPTSDVKHLFKLLNEKIASIEPGAGIELFILEAPKVEEHLPMQEKLWHTSGALLDPRLGQFIDRLNSKMDNCNITRFLPDEHYWPERSYTPAAGLDQKATSMWRTDKPRPVQILPQPEKILVTAPIPDYPPMLFRYKGKLHKVSRADGPERIEQEWWIKDGEHRDYYYVEDEEGNRYWIFRSGHYAEDKNIQWYIHGFFA